MMDFAGLGEQFYYLSFANFECFGVHSFDVTKIATVKSEFLLFFKIKKATR